MSWLPKRDKLDPVQASAIEFAVAQEGMKKVEKVGGGGDAGIVAKLTRSAHFQNGCCVMLVVVVL